MKALTLTQPWATLVAIGAKKIETRSWATKYRGPLAIHAAKGMPRSSEVACYQNKFLRALQSKYDMLPGRGYRWKDLLPIGAVIAVVELTDCRSTGKTGEFNPDGGRGWECPDWVYRLTDEERAFGDYSQDRYGWTLENVRQIEPVPAVGMLGLWEFEHPDLVRGEQ